MNRGPVPLRWPAYAATSGSARSKPSASGPGHLFRWPTPHATEFGPSAKRGKDRGTAPPCRGNPPRGRVRPPRRSRSRSASSSRRRRIARAIALTSSPSTARPLTSSCTASGRRLKRRQPRVPPHVRPEEHAEPLRVAARELPVRHHEHIRDRIMVEQGVIEAAGERHVGGQLPFGDDTLEAGPVLALADDQVAHVRMSLSTIGMASMIGPCPCARGAARQSAEFACRSAP